MDERFYAAFDRIYDREFAGDVYDYSYTEARGVVDQLDLELRDRDYVLRPDARVALLSNALGLVVLPAELAGLGPDSYRDLLLEDLRTIARNAAEQTASREITSQALIASTASSWSRLRTAASEFWD